MKKKTLLVVALAAALCAALALLYLNRSPRLGWEDRLRAEMFRLYSLSNSRGPYFYNTEVQLGRDGYYFCLIQGIILMMDTPNPAHDPEHDGYITFRPVREGGQAIDDRYPAYLITPTGDIYRHDAPASIPTRFIERLDMVTGGKLQSIAPLLLDYKDNPGSWKRCGKIDRTEAGKAFFVEDPIEREEGLQPAEASPPEQQ